MELRLHSLALLFLGATGLVSQEPCSDEQGGEVHIRIVSTHGVQARRTTVTIMDAMTNQLLRTVTTASTDKNQGQAAISKLPCGRYILTVKAVGLDTIRKEVPLNITTNEQWLTLAFPFESHVDHLGSPPIATVHGKVRVSGIAPGRAWIKLVGVYTSDSIETQTDADGSFLFSDVPEGTYIVIATIPRSNPIVKTLRVTIGMNMVELQIPATGTSR